ncbi:hypothetical protein AALB39_19665 [Lachnospiraceae bacterium 54-53]
MSDERNFVGYEYKSLAIKEMLLSMYADGYENFGWQLEGTSENIPGVMVEGITGRKEIILKLKRDRKIPNKAELTRLQRQFESCIKEMITLENSKVIGASAVAYIVGVIGTAFIAGSVFAYTGGMLVPSIILAVPGFAGWIVPYLLFCLIYKKKAAQVEPLIDHKHDEIYQVCKKANELL